MSQREFDYGQLPKPEGLLNPEEERVLLSQVKDPDEQTRQDALSRLVMANQGLVIKEATKHQRSGQALGLDLDDLVSEGNCGLLIAIDRFDPNKSQRLSTFATEWIRQNINRALDNSGSVQHPAHLVQKCRQINQIKSRLTQELQRPPSAEELAKELGSEIQKVRDWLKLLEGRQASSLDRTIGSSDQAPSLKDLMVDPKASPEKDALSKITIEEIMALFDQLPGREREVMKLTVVLALKGYRHGSIKSSIQATIGKRIGVSRQRVDQIADKAYARLQNEPQLLDQLNEIHELLTA